MRGGGGKGERRKKERGGRPQRPAQLLLNLLIDSGENFPLSSRPSPNSVTKGNVISSQCPKCGRKESRAALRLSPLSLLLFVFVTSCQMRLLSSFSPAVSPCSPPLGLRSNASEEETLFILHYPHCCSYIALRRAFCPKWKQNPAAVY